MPPFVLKYEDVGLPGKIQPVKKRIIAAPAWNRAPIIQYEPVKVLTEVPSTFLMEI
jgi:hypothetical protein